MKEVWQPYPWATGADPDNPPRGDYITAPLATQARAQFRVGQVAYLWRYNYLGYYNPAQFRASNPDQKPSAAISVVVLSEPYLWPHLGPMRSTDVSYVMVVPATGDGNPMAMDVDLLHETPPENLVS